MESQEKNAGMKSLFKWVYRLRSVLLAIPVAIGAIVLALHNHANLFLSPLFPNALPATT